MSKKYRSERSKRLRELFIKLHCMELNRQEHTMDMVLTDLVAALDVDEGPAGGSELVNHILSMSESLDNLYHASERIDVAENCLRQLRDMIPEEVS